MHLITCASFGGGNTSRFVHCPVVSLTRRRTIKHRMATTAKFKLNFGDETESARFAITRVIGQWTDGGGILSIESVAAVNHFVVNWRNESGNPGVVISTGKFHRLPGAASHFRRIDPKDVAEETQFFHCRCPDDADLL